jgi:tetratricopeptide (TPR) repeat protein
MKALKYLLFLIALIVAATGCGRSRVVQAPPGASAEREGVVIPEGFVKAEEVQLTSMRTMIEREYMEKANLALARLVKAQEHASASKFDLALDEVMQSIYIYPTADSYAMAGSLYHVMNDAETAVFYWSKAFEADPQIGRRGYIGLSAWIASQQKRTQP